jgi:hypothetical protein
MSSDSDTRTETAPALLAAWGPKLAPVIASMIAVRPNLAARLLLAPTRVIHIISAYVQQTRRALSCGHGRCDLE